MLKDDNKNYQQCIKNDNLNFASSCSLYNIGFDCIGCKLSS